MRTTASGKGKTATTKGVLTKEPTSELCVPVREVDGVEGIALGFRQGMLTLKDDEGNGGEVLTGAGLGTDAIILRWTDGKEEREVVLRGVEVLKAWVQTFDPEAAERFPV